MDDDNAGSAFEAAQRLLLLKRPLPASPCTHPPFITDPSASAYTDDTSKRPRTRPPSPGPDSATKSTPQSTSQESSAGPYDEDSSHLTRTVQPGSQSTLRSLLNHNRHTGPYIGPSSSTSDSLRFWKLGPVDPKVELLKTSASPADRVLGAEGAVEAIRAKLRPDMSHPSKAISYTRDTADRSAPSTSTANPAKTPYNTAHTDQLKDSVTRSFEFAKFADAQRQDQNTEKPSKPKGPPRTRASVCRSVHNIGVENQTVAPRPDGPKECPKKPRQGTLPIAQQRLVALETRILTLLFGDGTDNHIQDRWISPDQPVPSTVQSGKWTERDLVKGENRIWRLRELIAAEDGRIQLCTEHRDATRGGKFSESVVGVPCIRLSSVLEPPLDSISDLLFYTAIRYVSADWSTFERFKYVRAWVTLKRWAGFLTSRGASFEAYEIPWRTIELEMYIVITATACDLQTLTQTMSNYLGQLGLLRAAPTPTFDFASGVVIPAHTDRLSLNLEQPSSTPVDSYAFMTGRILQAPFRRAATSRHPSHRHWLEQPFLSDREDTPAMSHPFWVKVWANMYFAVPPMAMYLAYLPFITICPTTNCISLAVGPPMGHGARSQPHPTVERNNDQSQELALRPSISAPIQQGGSGHLMYPVPHLSTAPPRPSQMSESNNGALGGRSNQTLWNEATSSCKNVVHGRELSTGQSTAGATAQAFDACCTVANRSEHRSTPATSIFRSMQMIYTPYEPVPLSQPRTGRIDMPSGASSRSISAQRARHTPHPSISTVSSVQPTPAMSSGSGFSELPRTGHSSRDASCTRLAEGMQRLFSQDEPNSSTNYQVHRNQAMAEADVSVFFGVQAGGSREMSEEPIYMGSCSGQQPGDQAQLSACRSTVATLSEDFDMAEEKAPAPTTMTAVPLRPAVPPILATPPGMTPEDRPPTIWRSQTRAPPVGPGRPVRKRSASSSNIPGPMSTVVAPRSASQSRMDFIIGTTRISSAPGPTRNRYQASEPEDERAQAENEAEDADAEGKDEEK